MAKPRLRPFFSYFGSKWRLAPKYPQPEHGMIVEPFAGSACYSLMYPDRKVFLADKDPVVAGVWDYLIHVSESEVAKLPRPVEGDLISELSIPAEAKALMGFWVRQGANYPANRVTKFGAVSHGPGTNMCGVYIDRAVSQLKQIRHWKVKEIGYTDLNNPAATWYIDPPYVDKGSFYVHGSAAIDYAHLGEWCASRRGQTIVCENAGANWLDFRHFSEHKGFQSGGALKKSTEVIWTFSQSSNC